MTYDVDHLLANSEFDIAPFNKKQFLLSIHFAFIDAIGKGITHDFMNEYTPALFNIHVIVHTYLQLSEENPALRCVHS